MAKGDLIPEFKRAWVKALRSGKYEQGEGKLCKDGKFCCLGVAADLLYGLATVGDGSECREVFSAEEMVTGSSEMLPSSIAGALGMDPDVRFDLAEMNDRGKSFAEIADYIEENL